MRINKIKFLKLSSALVISSALLVGCSNGMGKIVEKEIDKTEDAPASTDDKNVKDDGAIDDEENFEPGALSKEQQKLIEKSPSKTAEDAAANNNLDTAIVIKKAVPVAKDQFTDMNEASQYISYLLFMYHSLNIDGSKFYIDIKPYLHEKFLELLPEDEVNRKDMFVSLQKLFTEQLKVKIKDYEMTKVTYSNFSKEAVFFRKYILVNGEEIFYKTTLEVGKSNEWLLVNDEPTPGYNTADAKFDSTFVEGEK